METEAVNDPGAAPPETSLELAAFGVAAALVVFFVFYRFGTVPWGSGMDEMSCGYNARLLGRTLHDQYNAFLPLVPRTDDQYKSPIFVYSAVIVERLLGIGVVPLRLVSALYAIGSAVMLFFLLRSLTGRPVLARWMALLSVLVPSLFSYARFAESEASCMPFYVVLALWMLRRFEVEPSQRRAAIAGACIGLLTYAYTTARLIAPLTLAATCVFYFFDRRYRRHVVALGAAGALVGIPLGLFMVLHPGTLGMRYRKDMSLWVDNPTPLVVVERIVPQYFDQLASLQWLFRRGGDIWCNFGEGHLPLWLFGPLVLGIASLWHRRKEPFYRTLIALWAFSPIPVALTWGGMGGNHMSRYLHFGVIAIVVGALGLRDYIVAARPSRGTLALLLGAALFEAGLSLHTYFGTWAENLQNRGGLDSDIESAMTNVFARRKPGQPIYLPPNFFDDSGLRVAFYADMDLGDFVGSRFDAVGLHRAGSSKPGPGSLVVSTSQPSDAHLVDTSTPRPNGRTSFYISEVP